MEKKQILSASEVCELLGISPITLWRERKAGRISFRRIASRVVFTTSDIDEYLDRNKKAALIAETRTER